MEPLLYVGCPPAERAETERLLAPAGLSVIWADNAASALGELRRHNMPVLVDLSCGAAALQIARALRTRRASTLVFAVADSQRPELTTEAVIEGIADVFARPFSGCRVANAIARELACKSRQSEKGADGRSDDLYSHSPAMRDVVAAVARASTMRAGVIVRGEEGSGRQVVARAIHASSAAADARFVCVDCEATVGDELDTELFGTAAQTPNGGMAARGLERVSRSSRLHDALGGTLYLRNLAEAPACVQAHLARILRDREAVLVETGVPINFDVRPIAGVDLGFDTAVEEARLREDLFRRLSTIRIDMPPLRDRREDIPALANCFLREICASRRVPPTTISRPALSLLSALPWRGNADELRSLLERAVPAATGRSVGLDDILAHVRLDGGAAVFSHGGTLRQARARFERDYVAAVLEQHRGCISEAARVLGIQRTNLYRKMRALHVRRGRRQQPGVS